MADNTRLAVRRSDGALRRLDPFETLNALQDEMGRLWRDPFRLGARAFPFGRVARFTADFVPRMDVYEQDNTLVVKPNYPA